MKLSFIFTVQVTQCPDVKTSCLWIKSNLNKSELQYFWKTFKKEIFGGLHRLILACQMSFVTSVVKWRHCLFFKKYMIVKYCNITEEMKMHKGKTDSKKSKKPKIYYVLWRQKRSLRTHLWSTGICNMVSKLHLFINWLNINKINLFR